MTIQHKSKKDFYFSELHSFAYPKNLHHSNVESYTLGGATIGESKTDLNTHTWYGYLDGKAIKIKRVDLNDEHTILEAENITELDFTFDQNMRPVVTYVSNNKPYIYIYDANKFTSIALDERFKYPKVELDNKILKSLPSSDVILGYTYEGKLCYRMQRDRFLIEYVVGQNKLKTILQKIGITTDGRFAFQWR